MINMTKYKLISVKFPEDLKSLVEEVSKKRGECLSTFIRRAVKRELARMSYLSENEKKALGIRKENKKEGERCP